MLLHRGFWVNRSVTALLVVILLAYLMGSIPTGYLVARVRGVDIRSVGSGNIGATNVFRVLGRSAGVFVLVTDAVKGVAACKIAPVIAVRLAGAASGWESWLPVLAGVTAILGHNYTCWLRFKGGKGIATTAGVMLALVPLAFVMVLSVWLVVFGISRYVSLASVVAAAALPVVTWFAGAPAPLVGITVVIGALAIHKHKANLQRLRDGTEHRFGNRKPATPPSGL